MFSAEVYPDVRIERQPISTKNGKFYATAGVSAGIDLALAMLEEDHGHECAAVVAREMVLFLRRPGNQAQISTVLAQQEAVTDARLQEFSAWVNTIKPTFQRSPAPSSSHKNRIANG